MESAIIKKEWRMEAMVEEQMIMEFNRTRTVEEACRVAEKYHTTYAKLQRLSLTRQVKIRRDKEQGCVAEENL